MTFIQTPSKIIPQTQDPSGFRNHLDALEDDLAQKADTLKEGLSDTLDSAKDQFKKLDLKDINRTVVAIVYQRPWTVIGLSFMAGVLLGYKVVKR